MTLRPKPHHDPWVDLIRGYITCTVQALHQGGLIVDRTWLDPSDPRDATIVLADSDALVWDEETGWRIGHFLTGEQGTRTVLANQSPLGEGVLPEPRALAGATVAAQPLTQAPVPYRSYRDRDGLTEALLRHRPT